MDLSSIGRLTGLSQLDQKSTDSGAKTAATDIGTSFESFLQAFTDMYAETDESILTAQNLQTDVALGYSDDIIGLTLAMEKANMSLNFTVQITNRLLEAYKEIMRIQM